MNSEQFMWLWEHRMTEAERDQWRAFFRDAVAVVRKVCDAVERYEQAGIDAAEQHANRSEP